MGWIALLMSNQGLLRVDHLAVVLSHLILKMRSAFKCCCSETAPTVILQRGAPVKVKTSVGPPELHLQQEQRKPWPNKPQTLRLINKTTVQNALIVLLWFARTNWELKLFQSTIRMLGSHVIGDWIWIIDTLFFIGNYCTNPLLVEPLIADIRYKYQKLISPLSPRT